MTNKKEIVAHLTKEATRKYKLPEEFAKKWIVALRSGEYKQSKSALYNSAQDAYCCLGVACQVAGLDTTQMEGYDYIFREFIAEALEKGVPEELTGDTYLPAVLADLNDTGELTFEQIADWIEENVTFYGTERISIASSIR